MLFVFGSGGLALELGFFLAFEFFGYGPGAGPRFYSKLLVFAGVLGIWSGPTKVFTTVAFLPKLIVLVLAVCRMADKKAVMTGAVLIRPPLRTPQTELNTN